MRNPPTSVFADWARWVAAAGVLTTMVGVLSRWATDGDVTLSGLEGPHNGWLALIHVLIGAISIPALLRRSLIGITMVVTSATSVILTVTTTSSIPRAAFGWGRGLTMLGGLILVAVGVWAVSERSRALGADRSVDIRAMATVAALVALALVLFGSLRQVLAVGEQVSWPPPVDAITAASARNASEEFAASEAGPQDIGLDYAWSTAASIEPWIDGPNFYPPLFADIETARSSVHIIMFGWRQDNIGVELAELVGQKLAEGVEVRVIVDEFGSGANGASDEMYRALADQGAEIVVNDGTWIDQDGLFPDRTFDWRQDELGRIDHRKLYVIDGVIAWTGGAGVEDHFRDGRFHDVMFRVTGNVVRQTQAAFLTSFHAHEGPLPTDLGPYFPEQPDPGITPIALLQVVPGGFASATQSIRELIDGTERRLDVMNSYLTDRDIVQRLAHAAERGVQVRLVVSKQWNTGTASAVLRHHFAELVDAGVEVWEYPEAIIHAKVIVADDQVMFGSVNFDTWSMHRDFELAMRIESPDMADRLVRDLFDHDIARSEPGEPLSGWAALRSWAANKLAYFL